MGYRLISFYPVAAVYDQTSAMMWFYFLIVGGIMGIIVGIYRKRLQNKWS